MVETRLRVGLTSPSNTHQNPVGLTYERVHDRLYKSKNEDDYAIHQLQEDYGVKWILIDGNLVHDETNSYFEQIPQPNGDIYLRLVDIFSSKNRDRPQVSQQADDHTEDHHV